MDTTDAILKAMNNHGEDMKSGDISETTEINKKLVDKTIHSLKNSGMFYSSKRCFYSPK